MKDWSMYCCHRDMVKVIIGLALRWLGVIINITRWPMSHTSVSGGTLCL